MIKKLDDYLICENKSCGTIYYLDCHSQCPNCSPAKIKNINNVLKRSIEFIENIEKLDKQMMHLESQHCYIESKKRDIEKIRPGYERNKKIMLDLLNITNKKSYSTKKLTAKTRSHKTAQITCPKRFMNWVKENCSENEFYELFIPKKQSLNNFISEKINNKRNTGDIFFEIEGMKIESFYETIKIDFKKEQKNGTKK